MSIIQYNNRNAYKTKAALEFVFKKSMDYRLPPGYRSLDICLVGGGAGGMAGGGSRVWDSPSGATLSRHYSGPGGQGGYVTNYYDVKVDNNFYFSVSIGKGGKGVLDKYPTCTVNKNSKGGIESVSETRLCVGDPTFLKDLRTNKIILTALGGQGFFITKEKGRYMKAGGGNLGGGAFTQWIFVYGDPWYYRINMHNECVGASGGNPIPTYEPDMNRKSIYMDFPDMDMNDKLYYRLDKRKPIALYGNLAIDLPEYGPTRIFKDGPFLAGGGCANNFGYGGEFPPVGGISVLYTNDTGGGSNARLKAIKNGDYTDYVLYSNAGNGLPNTGGGGGGGIMIHDPAATAKHKIKWLAKGGDGGSGLCVIRAYPDDKRPRINFIDGINRYVFK